MPPPMILATTRLTCRSICGFQSVSYMMTVSAACDHKRGTGGPFERERSTRGGVSGVIGVPEIRTCVAMWQVQGRDPQQAVLITSKATYTGTGDLSTQVRHGCRTGRLLCVHSGTETSRAAGAGLPVARPQSNSGYLWRMRRQHRG